MNTRSRNIKNISSFTSDGYLYTAGIISQLSTMSHTHLSPQNAPQGNKCHIVYSIPIVDYQIVDENLRKVKLIIDTTEAI